MDPKRFTRRLIALGAAMFLCALVFVVTLFDAQIVNGDDYLDKSIRTNAKTETVNASRGILTDRKSPRKLAETVVEELDVNTPGVTTPVRRLSGGNVQKVLVGREIAASPSVLMTAYAVRGLDINTSYTIYNLLTEQKMHGVAVVYVGEDLDVLLELCDRIVVLCGGQVSGVVDARKTDKREVGALMTLVRGGNKDE